MRSTNGLNIGGLKVGLAVGIALLGASACASNSRQTDLAYVEQPVEMIYNNGLKSLDRTQWAQSAAQWPATRSRSA